MTCTDFEISSNNKFIICTGQEGVIKVFDYFMRGKPLASSQMFLGHFKWPRKVTLSHDMKYAYSVGDFNGLYRWMFHGDPSLPEDLMGYCEKVPSAKKALEAMTED